MARVGATAWYAVAGPGSAALATNNPPPPNETATAAPKAAQRLRHNPGRTLRHFNVISLLRSIPLAENTALFGVCYRPAAGEPERNLERTIRRIDGQADPTGCTWPSVEQASGAGSAIAPRIRHAGPASVTPIATSVTIAAALTP